MANSFGSYGPAGPGFGSIQNAPATGMNPTAFPTAPPSPGIGGGGLSPGGLGGMAGSGGLGNMVGAQVSPLATGPTPQPYRAPLPMPPPAAAAASAPAAAPPFQDAQQYFGNPSPLNPSGNVALGMANWGGFMSPQTGGSGGGSLFGLGQVGAGGNRYLGMGSGNGGAAGNGSSGGQ